MLANLEQRLLLKVSSNLGRKEYNIIELTYDFNKGIRYKTKGHDYCQFDKLYIMPCKKSLDCQYFQKIFLNIPLKKDLDILDKQQYYIRFCHKV
jgi:hypothetical protein